MALSIANIEFVIATQYLPHIKWDETNDISYDFAVKSDGLVLCNRFGEMMIRTWREDKGKFVYFIVTFNGMMENMGSFSALDIVMFGDDVEWFIQNFFVDRIDTDFINDYDDEINDDEKYNTCDERTLSDHEYDGWSEWYGEKYTIPNNTPSTPEGYNCWGDWYDSNCCDEKCIDDDDLTVDYSENYTFSNNETLIPGINYENSNYSRRYYLVLDEFGNLVKTATGKYVSRITKDNGSYRYYLTTVEAVLDSDEYERMKTFYVFKSSFVGRDLTTVLTTYL
jgi:hypothetical protein